MADQGYKIGPVLADRVIATVKRVEAMPYRVGFAETLTRFEDQGYYQPPSVRLGKTTAAWPKGAVSTIELYEEGTPPLETRNASNYTLADCVNKFSDIDANKWVMVAKASNGRWYLISAECG